MAMHSDMVLFLKRLFRRRLVLLAAVIIVVFVASALFASWVAPFDPSVKATIRCELVWDR